MDSRGSLFLFESVKSPVNYYEQQGLLFGFLYVWLAERFLFFDERFFTTVILK